MRIFFPFCVRFRIFFFSSFFLFVFDFFFYLSDRMERNFNYYYYLWIWIAYKNLFCRNLDSFFFVIPKHLSFVHDEQRAWMSFKFVQTAVYKFIIFPLSKEFPIIGWIILSGCCCYYLLLKKLIAIKYSFNHLSYFRVSCIIWCNESMQS